MTAPVTTIAFRGIDCRPASDWRGLDDTARWRADAEHNQAQRRGKTHFRLAVAKVEKDVRWENARGNDQ